MAGIERAVGVQESGQFPVGGVGDRAWRRPEQSVVHDQKIHTGGRGLLERRQAGVDRGADFGDAAAVGDLQAVGGTGKIRESCSARAPVAVGDDFFKRGHALLYRTGRPVQGVLLASRIPAEHENGYF